MRKADVIIPTFKPGDKLEKLLRRLLEQSVPVGRVIIMNTEEKYWDAERTLLFAFPPQPLLLVRLP